MGEQLAQVFESEIMARNLREAEATIYSSRTQMSAAAEREGRLWRTVGLEVPPLPPLPAAEERERERALQATSTVLKLELLAPAAALRRIVTEDDRQPHPVIIQEAVEIVEEVAARLTTLAEDIKEILETPELFGQPSNTTSQT